MENRHAVTKRQASHLGWRPLLLMAIVCAGMQLDCPGVEVGIGQVYGQQSVAPMMTNLQSGEVVTNSGDRVQVGGKTYPLHPAVMIQDDEGRPRQIKEVVPGMLVKFHVKGEQIDQLIIVLPR